MGGWTRVFAAVLTCNIVIAMLTTTSAMAQTNNGRSLNSFSLDEEKCNFGPEMDVLFDELQREHDAQAEQAGLSLKTFDNQEEEQFEVFRQVDGWFQDLEITAISISFDIRSVYFSNKRESVLQRFTRAGIVFRDNNEPQQSAEKITGHASVSGTGDAVWNDEIQKTELQFSEYGKTRLSCSLPSLKRLADADKKTVEEFAKVELDPALWTTEVDRLDKIAAKARRAGDYTQAAAASGSVISALDRAGGTDGIEYALALDSYAVNLADLGRKREAGPLMARAFELSEKILSADHPRTSNILGHYALVLNALGESTKARPLMNRVYTLNVDLLGDDHPDTIESLNNLGVITADLIRLGGEAELSLEDAQDELVRAFAGNQKRFGDNDPRTLISLINFALVIETRGFVSKAEPLFSRGLDVSREVLGDTHPATIAAAASLANNRLLQKSRAADAVWPAHFAVRGWNIRRDNLVSGPRDEVQRDRNDKAQRTDNIRFADAAWSASDADPNKLTRLRTDAFQALQDAMAGSTDRAVAQMAARKETAKAGKGLSDLAVERQALSDQWRENETLLTTALADSSAIGARKREKLRRTQGSIDQRMKAIDVRLRAEAPDYFSFTNLQALGLSEARSLLAVDEAVLMVVPGKYGTHVMAITSDGIEWQRSGWTETQINAAVQRLLWDVGALEVDAAKSTDWLDEGEGAYPFDRKTAYRLYNKVVAPVATSLTGKRHVFVAASGSLSSLPFGLLVTEEPTGVDGDPAQLRATKWFADAHALVQIPSLQSLQFLRLSRGLKGRDTSDASFIGFGDPVLGGQAVTRGGGSARRGGGGAIRAASFFREGQTATGSSTVDATALKNLARLPGTAQEITALGEVFGSETSQIFLAERATESNFRNLDLRSAGILTLATHGLVAGELNGGSEPGLVFTPPEFASPDDDGLLSASEISGLNLNAEWVILSACNTAAGDGSEGAPGLSGLARSFFYAGARNLLASHWPVRDDVAARITVRTVEIGRDNPRLSRAEAFQSAIREIRNDTSADSDDDTWAHPNAWAPFTLIGDR